MMNFTLRDSPFISIIRICNTSVLAQKSEFPLEIEAHEYLKKVLELIGS